MAVRRALRSTLVLLAALGLVVGLPMAAAGDDNDAFTTAVLTFLDRIPPIPQPRQAPDQ